MTTLEMLKLCVGREGSDLFVLPGAPVMLHVQGTMQPLGEEKLRAEDTARIIREVYGLANREQTKLLDTGDDDFSFSVSGTGRFRCNTYQQRNSLAMVLRVMSFELPDAAKFHVPPEVLQFSELRSGLVLVSGPAGSGKSTTLACIVDRINAQREAHIVTIEDPIEFLHPHKRGIVSQRELGLDTATYATALRAAMRQRPDVILVGEMRDLDTIQTVVTAAETGQLVLSTLHATGAANTIDRIIDVFPPSQQQQVRVQLAMVLQGVISQLLVPAVDGTLVPAFEVMRVNGAIRSLIRENKTFQIGNVLFSSDGDGMRTLDSDLARLCRDGVITKENALKFASDPTAVSRRLGGGK